MFPTPAHTLPAPTAIGLRSASRSPLTRPKTRNHPYFPPSLLDGASCDPTIRYNLEFELTKKENGFDVKASFQPFRLMAVSLNKKLVEMKFQRVLIICYTDISPSSWKQSKIDNSSQSLIIFSFYAILLSDSMCIVR